MRRWVALAATLVAAACGGGGADEEAEVQGGALEGLSPEQIENRAEAMSPQEAEALGIVDSTIHVERLTSPEDSALIREGALARDSAPR